MMATTLDAFLSEELDALRQKHLFRSLRVLEGQQLPEASFDGHSVINLSSNNYLGLNTHRRLVEAAKQATETLGVGSGAVRTIAGTMQIHMDLEEAIERLQKEDASAAGIAKLRLFAGLSVEEAALAQDVPRATAFRRWTYARAWLADALQNSDTN